MTGASDAMFDIPTTSLLLGISESDLIAEFDRQRAAARGRRKFIMKMPMDWMRNGRRTMSEAEAATGSDDMGVILLHLRKRRAQGVAP